MKKSLILSLTMFLTCSFALAQDDFQQKIKEFCKQTQNHEIENLRSIQYCTKGGTITLGDLSNMESYSIEGLSQGKCHYKKIKINISSDDFSVKTVANCYAPMYVMENYANNKTKFVNKMCDSNNTFDKDPNEATYLKTLAGYCK